jgi:hypothetical protein
MAYEVFDSETSHGTFDTLAEARSCVSFDRISACHEIQLVDDDGNFLQRVQFRDDSDDSDPENIYGSASMRQSVAEDRRR